MGGEHADIGSTAVVGPIGAQVGVWRARRRLSRAELAERSGLRLALVEGVETGQEWVGRRGVLAELATALKVDPGELAGQPYAPVGAEHSEVRAVAHRLRKALAGDVPRPAQPSAGALDEAERLVTAATAADRAGDEYGLAVVAPALISAAERAVRETAGAAHEQAVGLRVRGHATVAGLLRRVGYRDLAWLLLNRARASARGPAGPVAAERARLLLDLGLPDQALACVESSGSHRGGVELSILVAFAHAMAGRSERAATELDAAAARARNPESHAVAAARVAVAVESGDVAAAAGYAAHLDPDVLAPADRAPLLRALAVSAASAGRLVEAAGHLASAEATSPLRFRLDPFARELLAVLPTRLGDCETAERLRAAGRRAGLP